MAPITLGGNLSGNGLTREPVNGQITPQYDASGGTVKFWEGGFLLLKTHTFAVGEDYRLDTEHGSFHDVEITSIEGGVVRFRTR